MAFWSCADPTSPGYPKSAVFRDWGRIVSDCTHAETFEDGTQEFCSDCAETTRHFRGDLDDWVAGPPDSDLAWTFDGFVPRALALPLDPEPWVAWGMRYPTKRGSTYLDPREGYDQDPEHYRKSSVSGEGT